MGEASVIEDHERSRRTGSSIRTGRLEAFSDGVFAIAITVLVLELAVPALAEDDLLHTLGAQWPSYLAYFVSFATIGSLWLAHTVMTEHVDHADAVFMRLNLLVLLVVSVLPFTTRLVGEFVGEDKPERVAVTIYGINLILASVVLSLLWRYAAHARLLDPDVGEDDFRILTQRFTPGIGGYVVLLIVGQFRPTIAVVGFLVIALFLMLPFARPERRDHSSAPGSDG